jgi:putative transposase
MALSSGIKFRCYPTEEQEIVLSKWMGCQRFIYNAKVAEDRYYRSFARKALSLAGETPPVDQQYSRYKNKELTPFLYEVPPEILRNGATRFMGAYSRFFKGLAGRPAFKKRYGRQSVWITRELFSFTTTGKEHEKQGKAIYDHKLIVGKGRHGIGELAFKAHDAYDIPATITISRQADKWFVSFSNEKSGALIPDKEIIDYYSSLTEGQIDTITQGFDRGVATPLAGSCGEEYDFKEIERIRMKKREKRKRHYQKLLARRKPGSNRRKKMGAKAARCSLYQANVRNEFAHQVSRKLVNAKTEIFVFEDLKIKNMTKAPEPKKDNAGNYVRNGGRAKAGLSKAILDSAWGKTKQYVTYKARKQHKLVIVVPPHCSSLECSKCSHTHPDNRSDRLFECQNCGFTGDADTNAAAVIKKRGINKLRDGEIFVKQTKRVMRLKKKERLGQERAEATHGEKDVRRSGGRASAPRSSVSRETPTTTVLAV